ncbi:hypothetical protein [Capnocytophaga sputigena]|jgi:hypothetical protein
MNKVKILLLLCIGGLFGCQWFGSQEAKKGVPAIDSLVVKDTSAYISLEEAEDRVLALPLAKRVAKYIETISDGKRGISYFSDAATIDGEEFYEIRIGYDSSIRFETYYILYVNRNNDDDIRIIEPVSGDIIPISAFKDDKEYDEVPEEYRAL